MKKKLITTDARPVFAETLHERVIVSFMDDDEIGAVERLIQIKRKRPAGCILFRGRGTWQSWG